MSTLTTGLTAFWKFNGDGTDATGTYNLTAVNSPTFEAGVVSQATKCLSASAQSWYYPNNPAFLPGNTDFSVAGWVYEISSLDTSMINVYNATTAGSWQLKLGGAPALRVTNQTSGITVASSTNPGTGVWYFVAAWFDHTAATLNISVNDGAVASGSTGGIIPSTASTNKLTFATRDGRNQGNMLLDAIGYWSRILTTQEITNLYNGGAGLEYPFEAAPVIGPFPTHFNV